MLVLTRRAGQAVLVGEEVEVKVLAVKGSTVRLGFEAPDEINIARAESRDNSENE
jgi:carbon storage regulator